MVSHKLITVLMNLSIVEKKNEEKDIKPIKIDTKHTLNKIGINEPCFCG